MQDHLGGVGGALQLRDPCKAPTVEHRSETNPWLLSMQLFFSYPTKLIDIFFDLEHAKKFSMFRDPAPPFC